MVGFELGLVVGIAVGKAATDTIPVVELNEK